MKMKKSNDKFLKREPVSGVFTGAIFTLAELVCLGTTYYSYFADQGPLASKLITGAVMLFIMLCIGCLIPSLRDSGFRYYMLVRERRLEKIKKEKEKGKTLNYPGKWQNFVYKTFRDGSVAEECSESLRKLKRGEPSYLFLKDCETVQDSVDKHRDIATRAAIDYQRVGIRRSYHNSGKYQCIDTGFLLFSVLAVVLAPVNLYLNYFKNHDFSIVLPLVFGGFFFVLHKLCKQKSKDLAHRYLTDINNVWKQEEERMAEKKKKEDEERKKKAPLVIDQRYSTNPVAQVGDDNTNITSFGDHGLSSSYVKQELKKANVSEDTIESIMPQIDGIVTECNKEEPDRNELHSHFAKVKEEGGNSLLKAFKFLTQTVVQAIIQNLLNKAL
jgi:hypothetical protein